ncbi:hypothetical protein TSTA_046180 [Talaromyces stipitatus ATCC 10500]|uniref:Uncharacterized protein n=1 Tax=Talaromyces stipitatus (strain ATCC 10500 / CBS 375.48 / QM 6759 / NRRL 1006) TaxID=441959 RepID=B8MJG4_TALSN|nr:uncharacterized protein TSTA_046180 [Talaromyces stipitatus ATCC 10500]EED15164.1 hypothetical protein TSTA_046180 [Talaromyces stipitatus ATCC 10500]
MPLTPKMNETTPKPGHWEYQGLEDMYGGLNQTNANFTISGELIVNPEGPRLYKVEILLIGKDGRDLDWGKTIPKSSSTLHKVLITGLQFDQDTITYIKDPESDPAQQTCESAQTSYVLIKDNPDNILGGTCKIQPRTRFGPSEPPADEKTRCKCDCIVCFCNR